MSRIFHETLRDMAERATREEVLASLSVSELVDLLMDDEAEAHLDRLLRQCQLTADPDGRNEEVDALHDALEFCLSLMEFDWPKEGEADPE